MTVFAKTVAERTKPGRKWFLSRTRLYGQR